MAAATRRSPAWLALSALAVRYARSFPSYRGDIPNGLNVVHEGRSWPAVGHRGRNSGSGPENPFGVAFARAGYTWTRQLCEADSDDDGQSNGQELGDPNCTWTPGRTPPRTQGISHPGVAEDSPGPAALGAIVDEFAPVSVSFIACMVAATMIGLLVTRCCALPRKLFQPCLMGWSAVNLVAVVSVVAGLVGCSIALGAGTSVRGSTAALGVAAGLASALPLWWSFFRWGVHVLFGMSREAAWRIHIAFGNIALLFGLAHGLAAAVTYGANSKLLGLAGLVLMLLGALPAALHRAAPKAVTYDRVKVLHFLSVLGYVLALAHVLDGARGGSVEATPVLGFNALALLAYAAQRVLLACRARRVASSEAEVVTGERARHVVLRLEVPGFRYAPGQWCRLHVPSLSAVAHPFTLVPDDGPGEDHVRLFVKVSGRFTAGLAEACRPAAGRDPPAMYVQGPFGAPALPASGVGAVVLVLGGVGVTPALSLVGEARRACGEEQVRVYWSTRSAKLLSRSAPLLARHLRPELQCIRVTQAPGSAAAPAPPDPRGAGTAPRWAGPRGGDAGSDAEAPRETRAEVGGLPLGARVGREDVGEWIASVASDFAASKVKRAMLFVCGPKELVRAAQRAAAPSEQAAGIAWRVHVEQFEFLPGIEAPGPKWRRTLDVCRCLCRQPPSVDGAGTSKA